MESISSQSSIKGILKNCQRLTELAASVDSGCQPILCYGRDDSKLRLFEFIFGEHLATTKHHDLHLFRPNHLPNLVKAEMVYSILDLKLAQYLYHMKIVYLTDHQNLVDHLLRISTTNTRQALPIALIVDDFYHYCTTVKSSQDDCREKSVKRIRVEMDQFSQTMFPLCSLLIETMDYCSRKLKQPTFLLASVDLNQYSSDDNKSNDLISQLARRFFRNTINVDLF